MKPMAFLFLILFSLPAWSGDKYTVAQFKRHAPFASSVEIVGVLSGGKCYVLPDGDGNPVRRCFMELKDQKTGDKVGFTVDPVSFTVIRERRLLGHVLDLDCRAFDHNLYDCQPHVVGDRWSLQ